MARPKADKPTPKTVTGIGFVRAPDGNVVVVRGVMEVFESISPRRVDADYASKPLPHTTEPDNQGKSFTRVLPTMVKVGEHPVHGQTPERSGRLAKDALGHLLERAVYAQPESVEFLESLMPPPKPPKKRPQPTQADKRLAAERALDLLGKPDVEVRRTLLKAGRTPEQVERYLRERAA